jgi:hypothetical protein
MTETDDKRTDDSEGGSTPSSEDSAYSTKTTRRTNTILNDDVVYRKRTDETPISISDKAEAISSALPMQGMPGSSKSIGEAISSAKQLQKMLGNSSTIGATINSTRHFQDMLSSRKSIGETISSARQLQEMLGNSNTIGANINSARHFQNMLSSRKSIGETISSARQLQEMLGNSSTTGATINSGRQFQDMLSRKSIGEAISSARHLQELFGSRNPIGETIRYARRIHGILGSSSTITETVSSATRMKELIELAWPAQSDDSGTKIHEILNSNHSLGYALLSLSQPAHFASAIDLIESEWRGNNCNSNEADTDQLESTLTSIATAKNSGSFASDFARLPYYFKVILISLLIHIVLPQVNSISANLLTPHIEDVVNKQIPEKEKVNKLKRLGLSELTLPSDELRFISANNVWLRSAPSMKSEPIDLLELGQIVVFLEKGRNWTGVMIYYENGQTASGWVLTRYVAKFRK